MRCKPTQLSVHSNVESSPTGRCTGANLGSFPLGVGLDTGNGDQCCDNDAYCFVSTSGESRCCPLGSNCVADTPCSSKSYYCTRIATTSLSSASAATAANATETGCCGRSCPQPQYYLCPAALGGNCCPYGSECRADGNCVAPISSSSTTTTATTTGTSTTPVSPTVYCPSGRCVGTTAAEPPPPPSGGGGLSAGTQTGIAVTVVAGTGVIVGMLWWLWILRRRTKARGAAPRAGTTGVSEVPGDDVPEAAGCFGIGAAVPSFAARPVPSQPNAPGDIQSPVEIDSAVPEENAPGKVESSSMVRQPAAESVVEVHELEGTEVVRRAASSTDERGWDKETMA